MAQIRRIRYALRPPSFNQESGDVGEIFHIRSEQDGTRPSGCLHDVVSADGNQTAAHERQIGSPIHLLQLSQCIQQDDGPGWDAGGIAGLDFGLSNRRKSPGPQYLFHILHPLEMPGGDHHSNVRVLGRQAPITIRQGLLFALMRASGDDEPATFRQLEIHSNLSNRGGRFLNRLVVLHVPGGDNPFGIQAQIN